MTPELMDLDSWSFPFRLHFDKASWYVARVEVKGECAVAQNIDLPHGRNKIFDQSLRPLRVDL
jgi:hypothetical protein